MTTREVPIGSIVPGDTIRHNGETVTVCKNDIKRSFVGTTIFGDSYFAGNRPVTLIIYPHLYNRHK